ncbi:MAG: peptidylprolyl isomerase [bacterium]|nr:peptidylprolyl isomerase [bacterium]
MIFSTLTGCSEPQNPVVTIEIAAGGTIQIELYPKIAPNTVNNFISLIQKGYYDGIVFHRIIPSFMIQGGDPLGTGTGGPGYRIKGEFAANNYGGSTLSHTRGVISMARQSMPLDSAGSQFFIMVTDAKSLDGNYAAFGKVTSGMDVVDRIVNGPSDQTQNGLALEPRAVMTKVTVNTFNVKYKAPITIPK